MEIPVEKLLDKVSKKQIIAVVGMVVLYQLAAHPGYIFGIAIVAIAVQTFLDQGDKNENSNDNGGNVPIGD